MAVLKARSRIVYFRVSEQEFHDFSEMCHAANARSLSDLARSAMQKMLRDRTEGELFAERMKSFDELLSRVNEKLNEMDEIIQQNSQQPGRKKRSKLLT